MVAPAYLVLGTILCDISCWRTLPWAFFLHRFSKNLWGGKKKADFTCLSSHRAYLPDTESHAPCTFSLEEKPAFQAMLHEGLFQEAS